MTIFAGNSRHASAWAANIYNGARAAGKDHPHAIRILARAWTRVIYRCWMTGQPYDPAMHGAARRLAEEDLRRLGLTQRVFDAHHAELARILLDQIDALTAQIDRLTT